MSLVTSKQVYFEVIEPLKIQWILMAVKPHNVPTLWRQSKSMGLWWIHKRFLRSSMFNSNAPTRNWNTNFLVLANKVCGNFNFAVEVKKFLWVQKLKMRLLHKHIGLTYNIVGCYFTLFNSITPLRGIEPRSQPIYQLFLQLPARLHSIR